MKERDYYLAFSLVNGIGPKTFKNLLRHFKSAEKAWNSDSKDLKEAGLSDKLVQKFEIAKGGFSFRNYQENLRRKKASFIALCDKEYPELLKKIPNPPIVLFIKVLRQAQDKVFDLNSFSPTVGVVGTRKITNYGREVTKLFSYDLAVSGFTIISGLAMGVDAEASYSAIEAGGKTIAVLGNGVDLCFPSSNERLYDKILEQNGAIISEYPLGQPPTAGSFPSRNRIIAGLSLGVLVTEGAEDSGSLITADYAFKFNRKVFAVPGPITSQLSKAPLKLISRGAKLVLSADDILKEFSVKKMSKQVQKTIADASKEELKIIRLLQNESLSFDEILKKTKIDRAKLGSILSVMEIKGLINQNNGTYLISFS